MDEQQGVTMKTTGGAGGRVTTSITGGTTSSSGGTGEEGTTVTSGGTTGSTRGTGGIAGASGNKCATDQNTCATDDDCTLSNYWKPLSSAADCYCFFCPFAATNTIAADCENAYDQFCGPNWQKEHTCVPAACPYSVPGCIAGTCQTMQGGSATSTGGIGGAADEYGGKYKFTDNQISGWSQDPAAGSFWAGTDLVGAGGLDGGAGLYQDRGFQMGLYQDLHGPGDSYCIFWAMDFGTDASAAAMFSYQKDNGASVTIPGYDLSVAAGSIGQYADNVYATFGTSYFELQFSGFGDQTSTTGTGCTPLCATAAQFLAVLKAKTN